MKVFVYRYQNNSCCIYIFFIHKFHIRTIHEYLFVNLILFLSLVLLTRKRGVRTVMQFFVRSRQLPAAILLSRKRLLDSQFSGLSPLDQRKVGSILFRAKSGDRGYDFRKARKTCSPSTVARERSYDTRRVARARRRRRRRQDVSRRYKIYVSAAREPEPERRIRYKSMARAPWPK